MAMMDDDRPAKTTAAVLGEPLDAFSIGELEARIRALEAEIARVGAAIEAKKATENAANALFRR